MAFEDKTLPIQYSCYFTRSRGGEHFVPEHAISYNVSGDMVLNDSNHKEILKKGDVYFCRRNNLAKYTKQPEEGGEFRSVSIYFDQEMLRNFSREFGYTSKEHLPGPTFQLLHSPLLTNYMESLRVFEPVLSKSRHLIYSL